MRVLPTVAIDLSTVSECGSDRTFRGTLLGHIDGRRRGSQVEGTFSGRELLLEVRSLRRRKPRRGIIGVFNPETGCLVTVEPEN